MITIMFINWNDPQMHAWKNACHENQIYSDIFDNKLLNLFSQRRGLFLRYFFGLPFYGAHY